MTSPGETPKDWPGKWERCAIVSNEGSTLTVKIEKDGAIVPGCVTWLVRPLKDLQDVVHMLPGRASQAAHPRMAKGMRQGSETSGSGSGRQTKKTPKKSIRWCTRTSPFATKGFQAVVRHALAESTLIPAERTAPTRAETKLVIQAVKNYIAALGGRLDMVSGGLDALLTNQQIQKASAVGRNRIQKRNSTSTSKKRKRDHIREENDKKKKHSDAYAHILEYHNAKGSWQMHEADQRARGLETISSAEQRLTTIIKSKRQLFPWLWERSYEIQLRGIERRLWNLLKGVRGYTWKTGTESDLRGLLSKLGITGSEDTLFDPVKERTFDIDRLKWTWIKWERPPSFDTIRTSFIKQIILRADVVRLEFWNKAMRTRRAKVSLLNSYVVGSYLHGRTTWIAIEEYDAPFYSHGGKLYPIGNGPFHSLNPTKKYATDCMLITNFTVCAHGLMELWHSRGDLRDLELDDLIKMDREEKLTLGARWGVPTHLLNSKLLPTDENYLYIPAAARPLVQRVLSQLETDNEINKILLEMVHCFGIVTWTDNGDLMGKTSLNAVVDRLIFHRRHFKDDLSKERLAQIRLEIMATILSSLGKCTSEQLEFQRMLQASYNRIVPTQSIPYHPGKANISVTAEEARKWKYGDNNDKDSSEEETKDENDTQTTTGAVDTPTTDTHRKGYTLCPESSTGDGEAIQGQMCNQGGTADKNCPFTTQSYADKIDSLLNTLLCESRSMQGNAEMFARTQMSEDHALNTASPCDGGPTADEWKSVLLNLTGEAENSGGKAQKKARKELDGVTVMPGAFKGRQHNDPKLRKLDADGDPMHGLANATKHAHKEFGCRFHKRYPTSAANKAARENYINIYRDGGLRSSMTFRDWHNLNLYVLSQVEAGKRLS